jgi:hypothetical protein
MKKLSKLKFWTIIITIFAIHAFVFQTYMLLNLDKYSGYNSEPYPIAFYAIGFWLGKFLFFHFIPAILWLWYYVETFKIKRYYQNLQVNGMEILTSAGIELNKMVSIGIMSPQDAEDKKNRLTEEYQNEVTLNEAIKAEKGKLLSLNSLKKLNAIEHRKYVLEKSKVKNQIKSLIGKKGSKSIFLSINTIVLNSIFHSKLILVAIPEVLLMLIVSKYGKGIEVTIGIMFFTFIVWILGRFIYGFADKKPSIWDDFEIKSHEPSNLDL